MVIELEELKKSYLKLKETLLLRFEEVHHLTTMANIEELDASTLNLGPGTYNVATLNDARAHRKTAPDIQ